MGCISNIAKSIGMDCNAPIVSGYTGRGVLIPYTTNPRLTQEVSNPRIISEIALDPEAKVCAIDNEGVSPFDGTNVASNGDAGFIQFTKTLTMRIPMRGGAISSGIVEPLVKSGQGFIAILEKKDKVGDGSFEVFGALQPLKANADGITRNESENGGAIMATMSCVEQWFEVSFFKEDYTTTKAAFEKFLSMAL